MSRDQKRVRKDLDLRKFYSPVREDLNIHNYFNALLKETPPSLEFSAKTAEEHQEWAFRVIAKVKELAKYDLGKVPMEVEEGPITVYKGVELKKLYITTAKYLKCPAILAKPVDIQSPRPGIVTVHGHNYGKINTIGMAKSSSDSYYGLELAQRGFVTLSLDQWGWGERRHQFKSKRITHGSAEKLASKTALMMGMTAIGIRSWEVSRAIDYLETLDLVSDKFGVIGQSGGGTTAAFSSVIEERIDAAVISGYFCTWIDSIMNLDHCICNILPDVMKFFDLPDIVAARAPKPTFIVSGDSDTIFPQEGVQRGYSKLKKAYELYGKSENLDIDVIRNTGHKFRGKNAYPWLDRVLLS